MIRILIADDHPVVRSGIKQILSDEEDLTVLGEAENDKEVLQLIRTQEWDVLILDLNMPGRNGLDILQEVKRLKPHLPVLVLSMHAEDQIALRVIRAGAAGYLNKECAPEKLVEAIRKVHTGSRYVSEAVANQLARLVAGGKEKAPHELLSDREYQVMCLLASGKTLSEVAETLKLSVKTISTYRARILEKMNLSSNAALTYYAIRNELV
ncbi:MAG: DNA-binding response regulator [Gemmatales bacterium]|nr:MAG: DNA-binding response regulator [Gemmatales bacterium]